MTLIKAIYNIELHVKWSGHAGQILTENFIFYGTFSIIFGMQRHHVKHEDRRLFKRDNNLGV